MLDRNLQRDDGKGLEEVMNDNIPAESEFTILIEPYHGISDISGKYSAYLSTLAHDLLRRQLNPLVVMETSGSKSHFYITYLFSIEISDFEHYAPMTSSIPCDLHLLNLRPISSNQILLRLHQTVADCYADVPESHNLVCFDGQTVNIEFLQEKYN